MSAVLVVLSGFALVSIVLAYWVGRLVEQCRWRAWLAEEPEVTFDVDEFLDDVNAWDRAQGDGGSE
jgi:hypothetical protein